MLIPHHFKRNAAVAILAALTFVPFPIYAQSSCLADPDLVDGTGKYLLPEAERLVQSGHPEQAKKYLAESIPCVFDNDVKVSAKKMLARLENNAPEEAATKRGGGSEGVPICPHVTGIKITLSRFEEDYKVHRVKEDNPPGYFNGCIVRSYLKNDDSRVATWGILSKGDTVIKFAHAVDERGLVLMGEVLHPNFNPPLGYMIELTELIQVASYPELHDNAALLVRNVQWLKGAGQKCLRAFDADTKAYLRYNEYVLTCERLEDGIADFTIMHRKDFDAEKRYLASRNGSPASLPSRPKPRGN